MFYCYTKCNFFHVFQYCTDGQDHPHVFNVKVFFTTFGDLCVTQHLIVKYNGGYVSKYKLCYTNVQKSYLFIDGKKFPHTRYDKLGYHS
jgi:hypothetical protein